jgi:flagellar biosynthetic protein FliR
MENLLQELGIKANFSQVLLIWALLMSRVLPLILLAPFIGGEVVPSQVKLGVGIAFSILLYPFVADTPIPQGSIAFVLLMLKEVFIGTTIAYMASFAFDAARSRAPSWTPSRARTWPRCSSRRSSSRRRSSRTSSSS